MPTADNTFYIGKHFLGKLRKNNKCVGCVHVGGLRRRYLHTPQNPFLVNKSNASQRNPWKFH
jgi:hypothetical protein